MASYIPLYINKKILLAAACTIAESILRVTDNLAKDERNNVNHLQIIRNDDTFQAIFDNARELLEKARYGFNSFSQYVLYFGAFSIGYE